MNSLYGPYHLCRSSLIPFEQYRVNRAPLPFIRIAQGDFLA